MLHFPDLLDLRNNFMKLGLFLGYSGSDFHLDIDSIRAAEKIGFSSVWVSEAYGSDAVSPAAWILAKTSKINVGTAILQIPARTPACTAMTAMTLQVLSKNRFILGLGPSGPQVIEGWHGESYDRPLARTRECVEIIRKIFARENPVQHEGHHYQLPYKGSDSTGLGKPLQSILHPIDQIKIFTAAVAPKGIKLGAEIANGMFPIFMIPERFDIFNDNLNDGFSKAKGLKSLTDFEVCPIVPVSIGNDIERCRKPIKSMLALYIGGMGAPGKNFYNDYAKLLGYGEAATNIQKLYLTGQVSKAEELVPDQLVDLISLVGSREQVMERLSVWKTAAKEKKVSSLLLSGVLPKDMEFIAENAL